MSQIQISRLPSFYGNYDAQQLNQLTLLLEKVILELNSSYTSTATEENAQAVTWFLGD